MPALAAADTDVQIAAFEHVAVTRARRLVVALVAVHAARATVIRELTPATFDLAGRRITPAGHSQRISALVHTTARGLMPHRVWRTSAQAVVRSFGLGRGLRRLGTGRSLGLLSEAGLVVRERSELAGRAVGAWVGEDAVDSGHMRDRTHERRLTTEAV